MADRKTKVSLTAEVSGYIAGMDAAAKKTRETGAEAEKLAAKKQGIQDLGQAMLAIGAVAAVGFGLAVARFVEFDAAMSNVKAATQETAANMGLLREAALEAGASTVFTAVEAANAIEELGKAGLTTEQILGGGLNGALSLAAAGQLGVAEAAAIAAIAVKQFNLEGGDVPKVADLLAAGAGKAVGSVQDLAAALNQAGLIANGAGFSIEDTTGVLAAFADAGLLGSDAGTSLKNAIIKLQAPTKEAQGLLDKYGVSVYDANGQMLSFEGIAGQLESGLSDLDDQTRNAALSTIFGTDALRVANVLYEEGAAGIKKYVDQTNDSGYAAKVAADRLDNLKGDVEKLGGAFDTALIQSGSGANDILRILTQGVTGVIDAIGSAPAPVLATGLALTGVVATIGLVGGGALVAVPQVVAFKTALTSMGISGKTAAIGIGAAAGALAVVTLALGYFATRQASASGNANEFQDSLDQTTGSVTDYTRELVAKKLAESGAFDGAKKAGIGQKELTDAVIKGGSALDKVKDKLTAINTVGNAFNGDAFQAGLATDSINQLSGSLESARNNYADTQAAADSSAGATENVADVFADASGVTGDYAAQMDELVSALQAYGAAAFDVEGSTDSYYASFDELTKLLADGAGSLDQTTEAGRGTSAAMLDVAKSTNDFAAATLASGGATEDVAQILADGRQRIIDTRIALGDTAEAAEAYADKLVSTPAQVTTAVKLTGLDEAQQNFNRFITTNSGRRVELIVDGVAGRRVVGSDVVARAAGGAINGPGTGTSDSIPALLSNGEHVLTAAEVRAMGGQSAVYDFRRNLRAPTYVPSAPGYANGGAVSGGGNSERPIRMDGSIVGVLREVANGEATLVLNAGLSSTGTTIKKGWK